MPSGSLWQRGQMLLSALTYHLLFKNEFRHYKIPDPEANIDQFKQWEMKLMEGDSPSVINSTILRLRGKFTKYRRHGRIAGGQR